MAEALPLDMRFPTGTATTRDSSKVSFLYNRVSASYFDVLGIRVVSGRAFSREEERAERAVGDRERVGGETFLAWNKPARTDDSAGRQITRE